SAAQIEEIITQADDIFDLTAGKSREINATSRHRRNSTTTSTTTNRDRRSRSKGRFDPQGSWCRIHFLHRENARKCGRPESCSFRAPNGGRRQPKNGPSGSQ